jgi:hypothetical protein
MIGLSMLSTWRVSLLLSGDPAKIIVLIIINQARIVFDQCITILASSANNFNSDQHSDQSWISESPSVTMVKTLFSRVNFSPRSLKFNLSYK